MLKTINKIFNYLYIVFVILGEILILALVLVVSLNVFLRGFSGTAIKLADNFPNTIFFPILKFLTKGGFSWAEEIPVYVLIPFFSFVGMAIGVKENLHININVLPRKLPNWFEISLDVLKNVLTLIIGIVLLFYGIKLVGWMSMSILPVTKLPAYLQYIVMPIVSIPIMYDSIMGIFLIFIKDFDKGDKHLDELLSFGYGHKVENVEGVEYVE